MVIGGFSPPPPDALGDSLADADVEADPLGDALVAGELAAGELAAAGDDAPTDWDALPPPVAQALISTSIDAPRASVRLSRIGSSSVRAHAAAHGRRQGLRDYSSRSRDVRMTKTGVSIRYAREVRTDGRARLHHVAGRVAWTSALDGPVATPGVPSPAEAARRWRNAKSNSVAIARSATRIAPPSNMSVSWRAMPATM